MKKGIRKEEEEDDDEETRSEEREAESIFGPFVIRPKDPESQPMIDPAKQEEPAAAKGSIPLTEEQDDMVFLLAYKGHSHKEIMEIMGVDGNVVDPLEVERVMQQMEFGMLGDRQTEGEHGSERLQNRDRH